MAPLTEIVAAVVAHSSVMAFAQFGVVIEPTKIERPQPAVERVVARSPRKLADCPKAVRAPAQPAAWKA
jgi:hypothetical protein